MFMFGKLFGKSKDKRISELEEKVDSLEKLLYEISLNMKQLAYLSLRTGQELEALSEYVKLRDAQCVTMKDQSKKPDDFYN